MRAGGRRGGSAARCQAERQADHNEVRLGDHLGDRNHANCSPSPTPTVAPANSNPSPNHNLSPNHNPEPNQARPGERCRGAVRVWRQHQLCDAPACHRVRGASCDLLLTTTYYLLLLPTYSLLLLLLITDDSLLHPLTTCRLSRTRPTSPNPLGFGLGPNPQTTLLTRTLTRPLTRARARTRPTSLRQTSASTTSTG